MKRTNRVLGSALAFLVFTCIAFAQKSEKVEPAQVQPTLSDTLKNAVVAPGLRAKFGGDRSVEVWPAKNVRGEKSEAQGAIYPEIPKGAFVGVVRLANGAQDFRGQKIPAGTYTMRYALLPSDGNHLGVAPGPDFFLLVPVDSDANPDASIPYPRLVKMSAKAAGTNHPAAFFLDPPAKNVPAVETNEAKQTVLTFELTVNGTKIPVGLIVEGTGE